MPSSVASCVKQQDNDYLSYKLNPDWGDKLSCLLDAGDLFTLKNQLSPKPISKYYINTKQGKFYVPVVRGQYGLDYVRLNFDMPQKIMPSNTTGSYDDLDDDNKNNGAGAVINPKTGLPYDKSDYKYMYPKDSIPIYMILMIGDSYVHHKI